MTDTETVLMYGLYAFAYAVSLAAFVMTSMVWLRVLVVVSSACYAIYYFGFPAEPLWLDVVTELILVLVNAAMLALIAISSLTERFEDTEQFLYDSEFPDLSRRNFRALLKKGEWCNISPGFEFTKSGEPVEYLYYLLKGEVAAELPGSATLARQEGTVIGEISFRTGGPASARVTATQPCLVMRWPQHELRALCGGNDDIRRSVNDFVSSHMAQKLAGPGTTAPGIAL